MKLNKLCIPGRAFFILVATVLLPLNSKAELIIYQFQSLPVTRSAVNQPQVTADFQDIGPGKVDLIIGTANLGGAFLSDLYLNFDPADNVSRLHFKSLFSGAAFSSVSTGNNSFPLGGYGFYDIHFTFSKTCFEKSSNGEHVIYEISEPGLNASDFAFTAPGGTVPYFALADIQGAGGDRQRLGCSSVQLQPVPEPASMGFVLLATGAGCLRVFRRWNKSGPSKC